MLHLTDPVAERAWPKVPETFYFGYDENNARELLVALDHHVPQHPARFPIAIEHHNGPVENLRTGGPTEPLRMHIQRDYDPLKPECAPFDRMTARARGSSA